MKLTRIDNWEVALVEFLRTRTTSPFVWGQHDCCLFAADAVKSMTGVDLAADLRGYTDALGAARVLAPYGGSPVRLLDEAFADTLARVEVNFAQPGDIMAYLTENGETLGVCSSPKTMLAGEDQMLFVETTKCTAAWRF